MTNAEPYQARFRVTSQWNSKIEGQAQHRTAEYGNTTVGFSLPESGDSSNVSSVFTTSTSNTDSWSIEFTDASGTQYTATHNCGVEPEDEGGIVQLVVNQAGMKFSQMMPKSSSCSTSIED
ncbi:MAG: hypothetical protein QOF89_5458 [Acidobacteriota bacterium]|nr:hypothetical protein [Acidobacteriota bacterium]